MNISPTPRRYTSRSGNGAGLNYGSSNINNDHAYIYSDPVARDYSGDRIIPEEYKLNSQMINRLIKQNKDLISKLDSKQEEIDRLNVLVGSLRGKLIKYTEMNKKLQEGLGVKTASEDIVENEKDYIQVPKRRSNNDESSRTAPPNDDRINTLSMKLDKLADLVLENGVLSSPAIPQRVPTAPTSSGINLSSNSASNIPLRRTVSLSEPSEEDIMCRESLELKQMEDQIDTLKRKLLIKRENELRKISLNQELLELMDKLSMQTPVENRPKNAQHTHSPRETESDHCAECRHNPRPRSASANMKSDLPTSNPLETPTPLQRRTSHAQPDTINRVW